MYPVIFHVCGSFAIHSYGVAMAVGLVVYLWLLQHDTKLRAVVSVEHIHEGFLGCIIAGLAGGRLLYFALHAEAHEHIFDIFKIWEGGLAILGAIAGIAVYVVWYVRRHAIAILPVLDRVALYAPIPQAFGRIGCFLAGCCYGSETCVPWAVIYTHPEARAPLGVCLHPTQLYSMGIFVLMFIALVLMARCRLKTGQLAAAYLFFMGIERFIVDFLRADRVFFEQPAYDFLNSISLYQWMALGIVLGAVCMFIIVSRSTEPKLRDF